MKKTKKLLDKILLGVLTFLLIIYLSSSLLFLYTLNISKKYVNKNKIVNIVENIDVSKLFKDSAGKELTQITQIKEELLNIGISDESINELLNSQDVKELSTTAITSSINDILTKDNIQYRFDSKKIEDVLNNNLDELDESSNKYNEEKVKLVKKVNDKIVESANELIIRLGEKLQNSETIKNYKNSFYKALTILDFAYSSYIYCLISIIIISFMLLIIYIRKSVVKSLKWIGISFGIAALVLYFIKLFINDILSSYINISNILEKDFNYYINLSVIVFIILTLIGIIIYVIKKCRKKKVYYEQEK